MERSPTEPCKIGLIMEEQIVFRLKMHALQMSIKNNYRPMVRPSDVVKRLVAEHIPDYQLVDTRNGDIVSPAEARERSIAGANQESNGAKSRGSKRDGKEQADRTRGRARG